MHCNHAKGGLYNKLLGMIDDGISEAIYKKWLTMELMKAFML